MICNRALFVIPVGLCALAMASTAASATSMHARVYAHTHRRPTLVHVTTAATTHGRHGLMHAPVHAPAHAGVHSSLHAAVPSTLHSSIAVSTHAKTSLPKSSLRVAMLPVIMPPPLIGSRESLLRQNVRADQDGLLRVEDDAQLNRLRATHALLPIPVGRGLKVDPRLPVNRRYCRPWTAKFLVDLARAHAQRFANSIQVNSAIRTADYQRHLVQVNGNAAPAEGDTASPHLTGQTVDLAKKGMSAREIAWMREYLLPLEDAGKLDVEEEFQQACFHISVYKLYLPPPPVKRLANASRPKQPHAVTPKLLATTVR